MTGEAGLALKAPATATRGSRDIGFAAGIAFILTVLFVPIPPMLIDVGLAVSIAFAVLILMVALWIDRPLDFSAFPTVLLIATMLRLSLNVATTRLILTHGNEGTTAAGYVIGGFSQLVMGGDFVIGVIVFTILITVNFLVITKGATRIAEVGARFTLDAIPGKQMAIDADLSAGLIDEKEAQRRRKELEEESAFYGSMDGASKFVRGDAIAGLIITAVNIFGGIVIGTTRHGLALTDAADVYVKLSVGDGLVTQIPALIVSLAAGLLVTKGGNRGSADKAVFGQLGNYPRALFVAALLMTLLSLMPGLPFLPFALLAGVFATVGYLVPRQAVRAAVEAQAAASAQKRKAEEEQRLSLKEQLRTQEIEVLLGKQISATFLAAHGELAHRAAKMRRKFARQYGFVVPEIKITDDLTLAPKVYQIRIHGTVVASEVLRLDECMVVLGDAPRPDVPGEEVREPAYGLRAMWVPKVFEGELDRLGYEPVDPMSVLLTHLSEVIRSNLAQLLSYRDMKTLIDRLDPDYKKLVEEICPTHLSHSGLQAVLKMLLSERVSIRNLAQILEAIAEVAPHVRRTEQIVEHVRMRIAQQLCGDLADNGSLRILRLGNRWDLAFHQAVKRDGKGDPIDFDVDPRLVEQFGHELTKAVRERADSGMFVLVTAPDVRPYVRMMVERLFVTLPVLSHLEISRGVKLESVGSVS
ncbi:MAG: flagellar biosynthesis protein FlhA [Hyphomicrobiales bacterium]